MCVSYIFLEKILGYTWTHRRPASGNDRKNGSYVTCVMIVSQPVLVIAAKRISGDLHRFEPEIQRFPAGTCSNP